MKHLFVDYEIALQLKEKGFDEACLGFFLIPEIEKTGDTTLLRFTERGKELKRSWSYKEMIRSFPDFKNHCKYEHCYKFSLNDSRFIATAPLYQQVIDWFREKYNINIYIAYCQYGINSENGWRFTFDNPTKQQYWQHKCDTYYEALNKAIEEALKLI